MNLFRLVLLPALVLVCHGAAARPPDAECLIPSKPGGAMDLTCKLAQKGMHEALAHDASGASPAAWAPSHGIH
jgi:putative tricarboxylic transport membrane protein